MRPIPTLIALASVLAAGAAQAVPAGACRFDELALRMPAGDAVEWEVGHYDRAEEPPFIFTQAQFAMHSGGVRMDGPEIEGAPRYVGASMDVDWRFHWGGHVFAMPRGGVKTDDGRQVLLVRRGDKPVVDMWLGRCQEADFDRDAFEAEYFNAIKTQPAENQPRQ